MKALGVPVETVAATLAPPDLPFRIAIAPAVLGERAASRADEVDDIRGLLLEHVPAGTPACQARALAHGIALATLGDRHLWEDLGLPSRAALGLLMQRHFPSLVALNHAGMRWKKFLHRQLCLREDVLVCRSPSCDICDEQAVCFGPE